MTRKKPPHRAEARRVCGDGQEPTWPQPRPGSRRPASNKGPHRLYAPSPAPSPRSSAKAEYSTPSPPGVPTPPAIDLIDDSCLYVRRRPWTRSMRPRSRPASPCTHHPRRLPKHTLAGQVRRVAPYPRRWKTGPHGRYRSRFHRPGRQAPSGRLAAPTWKSSSIPATPSCAFPPPPAGRRPRLVLQTRRRARSRSARSRPGWPTGEYSEITEGLRAGERIVTSLEKEGPGPAPRPSRTTGAGGKMSGPTRHRGAEARRMPGRPAAAKPGIVLHRAASSSVSVPSPYPDRTQGHQAVFQLGDSTVHALSRLDLAIDVGEYVAVMGPSGSGKSTLLNLLGLLDRPTPAPIASKGATSPPSPRRTGRGAQPPHRLRLPELPPGSPAQRRREHPAMTLAGVPAKGKGQSRVARRSRTSPWRTGPTTARPAFRRSAPARRRPGDHHEPPHSRRRRRPATSTAAPATVVRPSLKRSTARRHHRRRHPRPHPGRPGRGVNW